MKNHPIIVGLKAMANGLFAFGWFASGFGAAWCVDCHSGWKAAMYFAIFVACTAYGIWCLYELGVKTLKNAKKG